ncbi:uncharacterized protein [Epargyreus clarus]|uniref:uncharacterized protein n=1 Tax=Epargyreus clarus TaxID=520877 RepID=UPI003C2DB3F8
MTIIFRDSELVLKLRFGTTPDGNSTKIMDFLFDFNIDSIEANLVNSSWPINKVLNSDGVEILASYHDDIVQALADHIVPYLDENLRSVTTTQLVNIVLNTSL